MDNKRLLLNISIMMALVFLWIQGRSYLKSKHPEWDWGDTPVASTQPGMQSTTSPAAPWTASTQSGLIAAGATTMPTAAVGVSPPGDDAKPVAIGSFAHADPEFAMALAIAPEGAGLRSVTLNDYWLSDDKKNAFVYEEPYASHETVKALGTRWVSVNGVAVDLSGLAWKLQTNDKESASYVSVVLANGSPAVEVTKTLRVFPRASDAKGFEALVGYDFRNLTNQPVTVKAAFNGPNTPPREAERQDDRQIVVGYNDDRQITLGHSYVYEYKDATGKELVKDDKGRAMVWVGTASTYFASIVRPETRGTGGPPVTIGKTSAVALNLEETSIDKRLVGITLETNDFKLEPGTMAGLNLRVFFGPKQRSLLESTYFSQFPVQFNQILVIASGPCSVCTFQWLISILVAMLSAFHWVFRDWGLAIICLVCIVRLCLHPITKRAQVNMASMGKMGPEIQKLKDKHGDDKEALNKAMMQFYKEKGATPILGCLPMFLQTPIWIALWSALQSTFELRQAPFLAPFGHHLTWIHDLAKPDALVPFTHSISLPFGAHFSSINLLPILLGVAFFLQQKLTPKPVAATPEQAQQQKMMQWMSLLFPLFLYNGPSGLNLYILTSTTIGIIEGKIVRDHIKQKEEAEKSGVVIVDAKPSRTRRDEKNGKDEPPKRGGIAGFLANLQAKADEIQRDAQKRKGKDKA